jgi:hypothetical protein
MKKKHCNHLSLISFITLVLLLAAGCGGKKTERELYEEVRSSIKYRTYKAVSSKLSYDMISVKAVNVPAQVNKENELFMRLLLGYSWAVTKKDAFAFAESDIVSDRSTVPSEKFLAHSINAIVMYENGWQELAKEESGLANGALNKSPDNQNVKLQAAVFHLIMGTLCIKDQNYAAARFHFAGFGTATDIHWPYQIVDAMADIQGGDVQKGLQKIKRMSQDPAVPPEIRLILADAISEIEKNTGGDVDSSLFWPKAVAGILLDQLKKSSVEEIKAAGETLDKLKEKLTF